MRTHAWNASKRTVSDQLGRGMRSAWRQAAPSPAERSAPRAHAVSSTGERASSVGWSSVPWLGSSPGVLIQWAVGSERLTGHADDPFSMAFGLPVALAIAAGLFGLLLGTAREAAVVDAPVRVRRFRRMHRAAVSRQGQLRGSPVPPAHGTDDRG